MGFCALWMVAPVSPKYVKRRRRLLHEPVGSRKCRRIECSGRTRDDERSPYCRKCRRMIAAGDGWGLNPEIAAQCAKIMADEQRRRKRTGHKDVSERSAMRRAKPERVNVLSATEWLGGEYGQSFGTQWHKGRRTE